MAGLGDLWDLILASLEATLFTVYLFTFRATRSFLQWASPPRTSATHRTVLLVGDGLAEGVGDTLAVGGLAARINTLFAAAVREARMPHTTLPLKLNWSASSAGRLHASSADWLPPPSTALGLSPAGGGGAGSVGVAGSPWPSPPVATKNLFASTFLSGRHATPDIVIILLGGVDARVATAGLDADVDTSADAAFVAAAAITAANILTLARYCSANGSAVCIGTVPAFAGVTTPAATAYAREVNRLLRAGVAATLNSAGYRPLARLCMDGLVGAAKKVEWRHWRAALGNRS